SWPPRAMTLDRSYHYIAGANMAFNTSALRRFGGFNPNLGRVGDKLLSGEELHIQRLLAAAGYQLQYESRASVGHHVPKERLTQRWFLNRVYMEGVSSAALRTIIGNFARYSRALRAIHALIELLMHPREWAGSFLHPNEAVRFASRCRTLRRMGMIWGLLAFSAASSPTHAGGQRSDSTGSPESRRS